MQIELNTAVELIIGFSIFNFILGYVLGKVGIANVESDLATIKGLVSGQQKVTVIPSTKAAVVTSLPSADPFKA